MSASAMGAASQLEVQEPISHPPAHVVVVSKMRREYTVAGERRQGKMGNVYFHANLSCIKNKLAHFLPSLLTVQSHVRQLLTPIQASK